MGNWLGKGFLEYPEPVDRMIRNGRDWFVTHPVVRFLWENPTFSFLRDLNDIANVVNQFTLSFLRTSYQINRYYNGRYEASELQSRANSMLRRNLRDDELDVYDAGVLTNNDVFVPFLQSEALPTNWDFDAIGWLEAKQTGFVNEVSDRISGLRQSLLDEYQTERETESDGDIAENIETGMRWDLWELQQIQKGVASEVPNLRTAYASTSAIALLPVTAAPGAIVAVSSVTNIILSIAKSLMATFVPSALLEGLTHACVAIVMKGAELATVKAPHFLAAAALKLAELPAIYGFTATFAGAWSVLVAYAPIIVLVGVIIYAAIKNRQTTGDRVFMFGISDRNNPDMVDTAFFRVEDDRRRLVEDAIRLVAREMVEEGAIPSINKIYSEIVAFCLDWRDRLAFASRIDPSRLSLSVDERLTFLSGDDRSNLWDTMRQLVGEEWEIN